MNKYERTIQTCTFVRGEYAGLTISSIVENRETGQWAKPLNTEYEKIASHKAIGFCPIGNRDDWSSWGFFPNSTT